MLRDVTTEEFIELDKRGLVIIDFYSTTCGPCKMLAFVLEDLNKTMGEGVTMIKADFDKNAELARNYGVTSFPTLVFLKEGKEVKRLAGLQQKAVIAKFIEEHK